MRVAVRKPPDHRVRTVIAFMEHNLNRKLTVPDLAHVARLAPARLRQLFKSETGKSPVRYLTELRMRRAKQLLETSLLSVKEITARIGISDKSHFARTFKRTCGLTPIRHRASEYQSQQRRKSSSGRPISEKATE